MKNTVITTFFLLISVPLFAQEFWSGTKNTTSSISRTGMTTFGHTNIRVNPDLNATVIEHTHATGNLYIRSVVSGTTNTGNLVLNDGLGNVGIGTSSPQAKLAVNGNILAKEVKVKTDITVPDYVFESGYRLPVLAEVEAYVKAHKHLPEIPSADDIRRDGLDLGGMNLQLLKKIEELTLHLIMKEKEITAQKHAHEQLLERVEKLERSGSSISNLSPL